MLLKKTTLDKIAAGNVTLVFRRWKRPTVKEGGTLRTSIGMLDILKCDRILFGDISAADARKAGFKSLDDLRTRLGDGEGEIYRICVAPGGSDPRDELRVTIPDDHELKAIARSLEKSDRLSAFPVRLQDLLSIIDAHPGTRAADLARMLDVERDELKKNVRKLKAKGLTISLKVGYKLSARGEAVLKFIR